MTQTQSTVQGLPGSSPLEVVIQYVNRLMLGRLNAFIDFTLTANVGTSTLQDPRIGANTTLEWMPKTANAAAEIGAGTIYNDPATNTKGSAIIHHANNAQTDRSFRILIIG